jgi:hypothetical protein
MRDEHDRLSQRLPESEEIVVELEAGSSSAANGSSISNISGSVASARAIDTRIFMPPDSSRG